MSIDWGIWEVKGLASESQTVKVAGSAVLSYAETFLKYLKFVEGTLLQALGGRGSVRGGSGLGWLELEPPVASGEGFGLN